MSYDDLSLFENCKMVDDESLLSNLSNFTILNEKKEWKYKNLEENNNVFFLFDKNEPIYKTSIDYNFKDSTIYESDKVKENKLNFTIEKTSNIEFKSSEDMVMIPKSIYLKLINNIESNPVNKEIIINIPKEEQNNNESKEKIIKQILCKKRGRKDKHSNDKGIHDKNSQDIIITKIKAKALNYWFRKLINNKISEAGEENKELVKIEYKSISNIQTVYNQNLLNSKLKDIFSDNISHKYISLKSNHNKIIIEKLCERDKYREIFSLTFLNLLEHLRKSKTYKEFEGLNIDEFYSKFKGKENDNEYLKEVRNVLDGFEKIFNMKKKRLRKKSK